MNLFWFKAVIAVILIMALVPLIACVDDNDTNDVETVTPGELPTTSGESTVNPIKENEDTTPIRIISLAPSNTETLFALGLENSIVGVTEYCDYPPEAHEKEQIGGFNTVDMERVVALDPDLIVAANIHKAELVPELERRGFNVITIDPGTLEEVLDAIMTLGEATDTLEVASKLVSDMQDRIDTVANTVKLIGEEEKPGVFYITFHDPIWTLGHDTITHELIENAGGINVFASTDGHFKTNLETVIGHNPDVILASTGHGDAQDAPLEWAQTDDRLRVVAARDTGRVYQVDANSVTRPGPRIVDGLELIAQLIHPEIFAE